MYLQRQQYIDWLDEAKDEDCIKIIHGVRGIGKTILVKESFYYYLISRGVRADSILYFDIQQLTEKHDLNSDDLIKYIESKLRFGMNYRLIIDEPQTVPGFQHVINKLAENNDIYIVSSSDLVNTELFPNAKSIQMMPLSINEYAISRKSNIKDELEDYIKYGGYPNLVSIDNETKLIDKLTEIRNNVIQKDIYDTVSVRSKSLFRGMLRYIINSRGDYLSAYGISEYMKSKGYDTATDDTVATYLEHLCNAHILQKINRFDIKKDVCLKTKNKYYLTDPIFGYVKNAKINLHQSYENLICIELLKNEYNVYVGKNGDKEITFLAEAKNKDKYYIQVVDHINDAKEEETAIEPFRGLDDGYKKIVITLDDSKSNILMYGYRHLSLFDFIENEDAIKLI